MSTEADPMPEPPDWPAGVREVQRRREEEARQQRERLARRDRMAEACQPLWLLILPPGIDSEGRPRPHVPALDPGRRRSVAGELLKVGQALKAEGEAATVADLESATADPYGYAAALLKLATAGDGDALDDELAQVESLPADDQNALWKELAELLESVIGGSASAEHARRRAAEAARQAWRGTMTRAPGRAEGVTDVGAGVTCDQPAPGQDEGGGSSVGRHVLESTSTQRWLKVKEAAAVADVNRGTITRAANTGELQTNGETGRRRRIDAGSLTAWCLKRAGKPERKESDEQVKRLVRRHCKD
jgi:hypothetical protein